MIEIDGSYGEGGGQILRTSLALSLITKKPFRIKNIRANRKKPGLMRQHLTSVEAAKSIGNAQVEGAAISSSEITFEPDAIYGGDYHFSIGTAGSTTLLLQTILPALLFADKASYIRLEGGTHNPLAPPFPYLERVYLPILKKMGADLEMELIRPGFFPAGGGQLAVKINPVKKLKTINLTERGQLIKKEVYGYNSKLPHHIVEREFDVIKSKLKWPDNCFYPVEYTNSPGPGNVLMAVMEFENITEAFVSFGVRNKRAEAVAHDIVTDVKKYRKQEVCAGEYLADQLLLPFALAGGGSFNTHKLSSHTVTNIEVIKMFLDINISCTEQSKKDIVVEVKQPADIF